MHSITGMLREKFEKFIVTDWLFLVITDLLPSVINVQVIGPFDPICFYCSFLTEYFSISRPWWNYLIFCCFMLLKSTLRTVWRLWSVWCVWRVYFSFYCWWYIQSEHCWWCIQSEHTVFIMIRACHKFNFNKTVIVTRINSKTKQNSIYKL